MNRGKSCFGENETVQGAINLFCISVSREYIVYIFYYIIYYSFNDQSGDTDLTDEGKGLPSHPFRTVAEPDGELVDEVQAQIIGTTCIQLLEDLYHLRTQEFTVKKLKLISHQNI